MKLTWAAPERNKGPLLDVLRRVLPPGGGLLLEIASGTGQHAAFFAEGLPAWRIQPSDREPENLASIEAHVADAGLPGLLGPVSLDVLSPSWAVPGPVDAVFCANMIHIAPEACTEGLLVGVARVLRPGGVFVLYGPFKIGGQHTAPSNEAFDADLRARDPRWGVRNLDDVVARADALGLAFEERVAMPANNVSVVLRRR